MPLRPILVSAAKDGSILYCSLVLNKVDYSDLSAPKRHILSYGQPKDPNGHKSEILTIDISFDGKFLISAGRDNIIKIWNLINYSFYGNLEGHKGNINVA